MSRTILTLCLAAFISEAYAQPVIHHCIVKAALMVGKDGTMLPVENSSGLVGSKFTVNTESGRVSGNLVSTNFSKEITVIDRKTDYNNYRMIARISEHFPVVFYLEIHDNKGNLGVTEIPFSGYYKFFHISGVCAK